MHSVIVVLVFSIFVWHASTQDFYLHHAYDRGHGKNERDLVFLPSSRHDRALEKPTSKYRKRISARSDGPSDSGMTGRPVKPSVKDISLEEKQKVLRLAMTQQRKNQEEFLKQSQSAGEAAEKSLEDEFSAVQKAERGRVRANAGQALMGVLDLSKAERMTELHKLTSVTAKNAAKASAVMMHKVGSVNKEMQKHMQESFNPLPIREDKAAYVKPLFTSSRPVRPGRPNWPTSSKMGNSQKHKVLGWVMEHQGSEEKRAAKRIDESSNQGFNAAKSLQTAKKQWMQAKTIKDYKQGKRMLSISSEIDRHAADQYKSALDEKEGARKQVATLGMIDKEMHRRVQKTHSPQTSPRSRIAGDLERALKEQMTLAPKTPGIDLSKYADTIKQSRAVLDRYAAQKKAESAAKISSSGPKQTMGGQKEVPVSKHALGGQSKHKDQQSKGGHQSKDEWLSSTKQQPKDRKQQSTGRRKQTKAEMRSERRRRL